MWNDIYEEISQIIEGTGPFDLCFRGHANCTWELSPSAARTKMREDRDVEYRVYFDFKTLAGSLLPESSSAWAVALSMQHHGLPTRLLDWTDSFAVALHFALREESKENPCVWILDPYKLNKEMGWGETLPTLDDLPNDYFEMFLDEDFKGKKYQALAVAPNRHNSRAFSQKSLFTIHDDLGSPINLLENSLRKFEIPRGAIPGAKKFLSMAGINEYSLFPDLDGLAREVKKIHLESHYKQPDKTA